MRKQTKPVHPSKTQGGFTLIELIVTIVILSVLAAIAIPSFIGSIAAARLAHDEAEVQILNSATSVYALDQDKQTTEVFFGLSSDEAKMQRLVDNHYLDEMPVPQQKNTAYIFSQSNGRWSLSTDVLFYSEFSSFDNIKVLGNFKWSIDSNLLKPIGAGEHRLLFENSNGTDYNIKVEAKYVSPGATKTGYGIYYRTQEGATNANEINGYCFQFDPGIGNRFVVRKVVNGNEQTPFQSVAMSQGFDINATHDIEIEVIGSSHVIKVDGVQVMNFTDSSFTEGSVGLRTWSTSKSEFSEATVTKR